MPSRPRHGARMRTRTHARTYLLSVHRARLVVTLASAAAAHLGTHAHLHTHGRDRAPHRATEGTRQAATLPASGQAVFSRRGRRRATRRGGRQCTRSRGCPPPRTMLKMNRMTNRPSVTQHSTMAATRHCDCGRPALVALLALAVNTSEAAAHHAMAMPEESDGQARAHGVCVCVYARAQACTGRPWQPSAELAALGGPAAAGAASTQRPRTRARTHARTREDQVEHRAAAAHVAGEKLQQADDDDEHDGDGSCRTRGGGAVPVSGWVGGCGGGNGPRQGGCSGTSARTRTQRAHAARRFHLIFDHGSAIIAGSQGPTFRNSPAAMA